MSQVDNSTLIQEASKYAYVKDGLVYLKPYLHFPERKIGEVKESEESSIKYFVDRFEIAKRKVVELSEAIEEAQNKGSYLMKLIHLKEYLGKFDAIGNYIELFDKLDEEEQKLNDIIAVNKVKNLEIKKGLIDEAKELLKSQDWDVVSDKFKEVRTKWIKTGNTTKEENDQLEEEFKNIVESFFSARKKFFEDRNRLIIERVNQYNDLLKQAEDLFAAEKSPSNIRKMKELQQEWKKLGKLPKVKRKQLNDTFKDLASKYFESLRPPGSKPRTFSDPAVKPWENLINQAEEIAQNFSNDSLRKIKIVQSQWQILGPIKKSKNSFALVDRFRTAVSKVYEYEFLNKTALRRFGLYFRKPEAEQLKLKIGLMNELILKANSELKIFEENLQSTSYGSRDQEMNKMLMSKLSAQKRKVEIMKMIMAELNEKLSQVR